MAWSGFVVRPFGVRNIAPISGTPHQVDFDRVQRELIDPAMQAAGIYGGTTELILEAGKLREDMFQLLVHADIVIVDASMHNANVFYELGVRHALRPRRTFMIRFAGDEVPFDLMTDRYLAYDRADPAASVSALTAGLRATLAERDQVDSPIFRLLPYLKAPTLSDLVPVPLDFRVELRWALERRRVGHLVLLGEEANALPWGAEGLRAVARGLFSLKAYAASRQAWEAVRSRLDGDMEADLRLATVHQRLKDLVASDAALERALGDHPAITTGQRAEALALRGSNAKQRWIDSWSGQTGDRLGAVALQSEHLRQAGEAYAEAFAADLNHYYSGINALATTRLQLELARAHPAAWADAFDSDLEAQRALELLVEQVGDLYGAVTLSVRRGERSAPPGSEDARWARCSLADAQLLRQDRIARVIAGYRRALDGAPPYFFDVVKRQLDIFARLGVFAEHLAALRPVIESLEVAALQRPGTGSLVRVDATGPPSAPDRVLLFAGHRIDDPGRTSPRFPAGQEATARQAMRQYLEQALSGWPLGTRVLGIAGGASGGDILFHEVCAELQIDTELYLPMPTAAYVEQSVRVDPSIDGPPGWVARFRAILERCSTAGRYQQLGEGEDLPRWAARLPDYSIWERNNRWMLQSALAYGPDKLTLLVLWDGQAGDAPGGTQHMVDVASAAGASVRRIDTRRLFGLG